MSDCVKIIKLLLYELEGNHLLSRKMAALGRCSGCDAIRAAKKYLKQVKRNAR